MLSVYSYFVAYKNRYFYVQLQPFFIYCISSTYFVYNSSKLTLKIGTSVRADISINPIQPKCDSAVDAGLVSISASFSSTDNSYQVSLLRHPTIFPYSLPFNQRTPTITLTSIRSTD